MISKLDILNLIDENEVISPLQLSNYFGMKYDWATLRLNRLKIAGLVEPLSVERGKWILSLEGYKKLDYLRREENDKRQRAGREARGTTG